MKKSYTENCKSELEKLRKKYQEAYRVEEIKEDELNQRCWQEQLALYHQKELSLQHLQPIPLQGGPPHKPTEDDFLTALGIRDTNPEAVRYIQEFKRWRERRRELNLPAIVNPLLESYYQIYSSDEEAEITHRLHEEESSDRENIERPQPAEVEKDQNTTGTDSDVDLQAIVALKEGNRVEHQKALVWEQRLQQKVKTSLKRCAKHNTPTQLRHIQLLQRLIKNELNKVNEKYAEVLEEATRERKKQLQRATTTPVEELLSSTKAEEEEGRGPEGTVDTVTPTSKSVPTTASTPTNSFEGVVPASTSKRKDITTKISPYFNLTFHFTTPTQTTTTSTKLTKKSTTKKTTVTEELSKRVDSTPVPKKRSGGASNTTSGTQKVEDKQPKQPDIAKEKNLASLEALRDLTKRVEGIKTNIRKWKEELTEAHDERIRRQELRECERREATEAAQSKKKTIEKKPEEKKNNSTGQEDSIVIPDSQQNPEVIEPTPPQDHQPSLTNSEIDKENWVVSPTDIDSNIEVPRGADNTVLDYTGLGLDIEFPNKSGISAVGEDLIDFSELDIRPIDKDNITLDEVQSKIFRLFDSFLIDNKNIMELIANKLSNRVTKNFQKETKIAEENQQMITQIVKLLANKDNKDDKKMGTQMVKAVTDVLSQYGIVKNKDGQSLDNIKESLVEIRERNDDSEFRGQPNIRHFDVGLKIDIEDWIKKYKDAMSDKKASIEKQVSQLKLLTDGAVNAWVKDWLKQEDYENKEAKGQLTLEWFHKLLKKMKKWKTNLQI